MLRDISKTGHHSLNVSLLQNVLSFSCEGVQIQTVSQKKGLTQEFCLQKKTFKSPLLCEINKAKLDQPDLCFYAHTRSVAQTKDEYVVDKRR